MNNNSTSFGFYSSTSLDSVANFQSPSKHYVTKDPNERRASKAIVVARGKRTPKVEVKEVVKYHFRTIKKVVTIDGVTGPQSMVRVSGTNGTYKLFIDMEHAKAWVANQK
jgi:hypothetical protein